MLKFCGWLRTIIRSNYEYKCEIYLKPAIRAWHQRFYHTVVGDNAKRLEQAIEVAESRADLIIFREDLVQQKMI